MISTLYWTSWWLAREQTGERVVQSWLADRPRGRRQPDTERIVNTSTNRPTNEALLLQLLSPCSCYTLTRCSRCKLSGGGRCKLAEARTCSPVPSRCAHVRQHGGGTTTTKITPSIVLQLLLYHLLLFRQWHGDLWRLLCHCFCANLGLLSSGHSLFGASVLLSLFLYVCSSLIAWPRTAVTLSPTRR